VGLRMGDVREAQCKNCGKKTTHAICVYFKKKTSEVTVWLKCTICGKMINVSRIPEDKLEIASQLFNIELPDTARSL